MNFNLKGARSTWSVTIEDGSVPVMTSTSDKGTIHFTEVHNSKVSVEEAQHALDNHYPFTLLFKSKTIPENYVCMRLEEDKATYTWHRGREMQLEVLNIVK